MGTAMFRVVLFGLFAAASAIPQFRKDSPFVPGQLGGADDDFVPAIPGYDDVMPSRMFSGYLNVSDSKFLHYVYVESENNPATDPVVLWLNGGPGCSSLDGFFYEHGPYMFDPNDFTKLRLRPTRWTSLANVLYLEAPVGVGFSYSTNPDSDYLCDDDTTAQDNLHALEVFFARFPAVANNPFFITGESYAGIYVPTLAEAVMRATDAGTYHGAPLLGIGVGNGCSGSTIGICGFSTQGTYYEMKYLMGHAFLSDDLKQQINDACDWESAKHNGPLSDACQTLLSTASDVIGNINIYNVFGDCITGPLEVSQGVTVHSRVPRTSHIIKYKGPNECIDSRGASSYFNQSEVVTAFHVRPLGYTFNLCGTPSGWTYNSTRPNLPRDTYPSLIKRFRVLIFNGDWDACVPFTDNEAWTENMGLTPQEPWHAWSYTSASGATNQVGGYAVKYQVPDSQAGWFRFITVRGGRHEVPESAPDKALEMLNRLLHDLPF
eukprot:c6270_g1_i1.p1 GENE.c6270_g1_i1~~c6270_g1_i1.p1  ORF type:complete len:491 (+),score=115.68 c6270_g1_i1:1-1473(+)